MEVDMVMEVKRFLLFELLGMLAGQQRLHVLFATYNGVIDYDTGDVPTGKKGLTIWVQCGDLAYSWDNLMVACSADPLFAMRGEKLLKGQAEKAVAIVEKGLNLKPEAGVPVLAFIYSGLNGFDKAVALAGKIKLDNPDARVVVTTCDCDISTKTSVLDGMQARGEIDAAVYTTMCGGREMMREILDRVIKVWPTSVRA
jgi:hypothetical protein